LRPDEFQKIDVGTPGNWNNDPATRQARNEQSLNAEIFAAKLVSGDEKIGPATFYGEVGHKKNGSYYAKAQSATLPEGREVAEPVAAVTKD